MSKLFNVGEVCVLQSEDYPQYRGLEVTIIEARFSVAGFLAGSVDTRLPPQYVYVIDLLPDLLFLESALKKKQDPASESFNEMMDELNKDLALECD